MCSYKDVPGYIQHKVRSTTVDTKAKYLCVIICPKKFKFVHNVFEVTELCPTRADILKPTRDRTLVLRRTLKYKQNPPCRSFGVDMWAEKEVIII